MTELERLKEIEQFILGRARFYGLRPVGQKFDITTEDRMFALLARNLPNNFSFWQFGRDYERFRTRYEHGFGHGILEVVFNLNPSRAYILNTVPFAHKAATICHVYGHNHFYSKNSYFSRTRRNMLSAASASRERFLEYENRFGIDRVERILNAAKAFEINVDPDLSRYPETQKRMRERLWKTLAEVPESEQALKPLSKKMERQRKEFRERLEENGQPVFPERDILFFILDKSPMIEEIRDPAWRAAVLDMLSVMWEQSRYLMPQRETHGINEGWATLWHERLMLDLLHEGLLTNQEFSSYAELNGKVLANHPLYYNPYLLFSAIWKSIEERWNKGRFGKEWEECRDADKKRGWDTQAGAGQEKSFQVLQTHNDWRFIDEFLTQEIIDELRYYLYSVVIVDGKQYLKIESRSIKQIKPVILRMIENFGKPLVRVADGNFKGRRELLLNHIHDGRDLDLEYLEKTLQHGFTLWGRPVHLRTNLEDHRECAIFVHTGSSFQKNPGCKTGECAHIEKR